MRIWIETKTKLNGNFTIQFLVPVERVGVSLLLLTLALGTAHWAGLAEMFVLAAVWWAELRKEEGGRRPKEKNVWEAGGVTYPG